MLSAADLDHVQVVLPGGSEGVADTDIVCTGSASHKMCNRFMNAWVIEEDNFCPTAIHGKKLTQLLTSPTV